MCLHLNKRINEAQNSMKCDAIQNQKKNLLCTHKLYIMLQVTNYWGYVYGRVWNLSLPSENVVSLNWEEILRVCEAHQSSPQNEQHFSVSQKHFSDDIDDDLNKPETLSDATMSVTRKFNLKGVFFDVHRELTEGHKVKWRFFCKSKKFVKLCPEGKHEKSQFTLSQHLFICADFYHIQNWS